MRIAHNVNGEWVLATNAIRGAMYFCPRCGEPLQNPIQNSQMFDDHFRHRSDTNCSYGSDETLAHAEKKLAIASIIAQQAGENNVQVEYRTDDGQRADVYFETNDGQGVAVEVQHSHIADGELVERTASYTDKKIASLWMPDNIKRFLNSMDVRGDPYIPLWMRRIAWLTDDVAFDHYSDESRAGSEVVSIKLKREQRIIRNGMGEPVIELYWPIRSCSLYRGTTRTDLNDSGHRLMLWVPQSVEGESLVSVKPKRKMHRREITEPTGAPVDCNRDKFYREAERALGREGAKDYFDRRLSQLRDVPVSDALVNHGFYPDEGDAMIGGSSLTLLTPANSPNEIDQILRWWMQEGGKFSPQQKIAMWGYK